MLALTACQTTIAGRRHLAERIAAPAALQASTMPTGPFNLTLYSRITRPGASAHVYIEGDGYAWLDRETPSGDPTPKNPLGLRLAAADAGANVIYLARPCEYTGMKDGSPCPQRYWTGARLAPEVITALGVALDRMRERFAIPSFELTGYSGGGGAAVLLAARRHDVTALRTVAGNIDNAVFTRLHGVTPMRGSLAPEDVAPGLANLPQLHFTGSADTIVPSAITVDYLGYLGSPHCAAQIVVPGLTHEGDWASAWPGLLTTPLPCR